MRGSIKGRHRKRFISVPVPKLHSCGSNPTSGGTNFPGGAQSFSSPVRSICLATRIKNTSGAARATARKPDRTFGCRVALFSGRVWCAHGKQAIPAQQRVKLLGYERNFERAWKARHGIMIASGAANATGSILPRVGRDVFRSRPARKSPL